MREFVAGAGCLRAVGNERLGHMRHPEQLRHVQANATNLGNTCDESPDLEQIVNHYSYLGSSPTLASTDFSLFSGVNQHNHGVRFAAKSAGNNDLLERGTRNINCF